MPAIAQLGMQAASGAIDAGMGLLLQGHNDRRQLKQQRKLQDMQIMGQKEMGEFNYGLQKKMWDETNYSAQKKHLEEAGLNPGLLYGMSGGGGATTGSTSGGSVTGATAPAGGGEVVNMMELGMKRQQLQLLEAQKENIEADTANKQADTANKPIQGENIKAGTELTKQQTGNAKVDERLKNIDLALKEKTFEAAADRITFESGKAMQELEQAYTASYVARESQVEQVTIVREKAIGAMLENLLTTARTENTQQATAESKAKIAQMAKDIELRTRGLDQKDAEIEIQRTMMEYNTTIDPYVKEGIKVIGQAVDGVLKARGGKRTETRHYEKESDKGWERGTEWKNYK